MKFDPGDTRQQSRVPLFFRALSSSEKARHRGRAGRDSFILAEVISG
jgi:hypothetical protein